MMGNGAERPGSAAKTESASVDAQSGDGERGDGHGPPHPLDGVMQRVREVIEYANFYVEARKDVLRAAVRGLIWKAAVGLVGAIAAVAVIIVSAVYLMSGIAHGLGSLFGERYWLGELVTGLAVFLILSGASFFAIKSLTKKARERTIKKYERRQQQQRERFGHSATDRAQQLRQAQRG